MALCLVLRTKHDQGDQVKQNTMGGLCGTYGAEQNCIQCFDEEI